MFLSSKNRLRALLEVVDDLLAPHPDEAATDDGWTDLPDCESSCAAHRDLVNSAERRPDRGEPRGPNVPAIHPHRRPLRWEPRRREGALPPPVAHCISPVRRSTATEPRTAADRANGGR